MRAFAGILAAFAGLCLQSPAWADIYAFVDDDGVTHFSNVPTDRDFELVLASPAETDVAGDVAHGPQVNAAVLARAARYDVLIEDAGRALALDSQLLRAVIIVESAFDASAVSSRGARGLMQLMPLTARRYGAHDAFDPGDNIRAGARYLRELMDRYDDDLELVLAAYNAGEEAVERYGRVIPPYKETQAYVPRVLRAYTSLRRLAGGI